MAQKLVGVRMVPVLALLLHNPNNGENLFFVLYYIFLPCCDHFRNYLLPLRVHTRSMEWFRSISNGSISNGSISNGSISNGSISNGSISNGSISNGSTLYFKQGLRPRLHWVQILGTDLPL